MSAADFSDSSSDESVNSRVEHQDGGEPTAQYITQRQRALPCTPIQRVSTGQTHDKYRPRVQIPPFWPDDPELWFAQIEGQFENAEVTCDKTKFNYIIGHLDPQFAKEVKDVIIAPPEKKRYERLKHELIKRLSASNDKKVHQLLMHEELGDRKPSQFLRHLQSLAGNNVPDDFLRTIWSRRLPSNLQTLLATQHQSTLENLAELADRVQDIVGPQRSIAAASSTSSTAPASMDTMAKEIAELKQAVKQLTLQMTRQSRPQNQSRNKLSCSRSTTRSQSNYRKFPQCWYHSKYGAKAIRCQPPCDFTKRAKQSVMATSDCPLSAGRLSIFDSNLKTQFLVDTGSRYRRLVDNTTSLFTNAFVDNTVNDIQSVKVLAGDTRFHANLNKFPEITRPAGTPRLVTHNTKHFTRTTPGPPVSSPSRRLAPDKLKVARDEFQLMLSNSTARPSAEPDTSPPPTPKTPDPSPLPSETSHKSRSGRKVRFKLLSPVVTVSGGG